MGVGGVLDWRGDDDYGLVRRLVEHICIETVDWHRAIEAHNYTHVLDFGPGGELGIGALTARDAAGQGVQVGSFAAIGFANSKH